MPQSDSPLAKISADPDFESLPPRAQFALEIAAKDSELAAQGTNPTATAVQAALGRGDLREIEQVLRICHLLRGAIARATKLEPADAQGQPESADSLISRVQRLEAQVAELTLMLDRVCAVVGMGRPPNSAPMGA